MRRCVGQRAIFKKDLKSPKWPDRFLKVDIVGFSVYRRRFATGMGAMVSAASHAASRYGTMDP